MKELHNIQASILKVLLFNPDARFTDMNAVGITTDHFNFHVKRLLELGLVQKKDNGMYGLTHEGKEYANRLDVDSGEIKIERQAKVSVGIACERIVDGKKEYLIQQRLKEPFFGFHGFLTGKVKWGETIEETAKRELEEETGLEADLTLFRIKHRMDYADDGTTLEDKVFFEFRGKNVRGTLKESIEGGKNIWMTKEDALALPDLFFGMEDYLRAPVEGSLTFVEEKHIVKKY